MTEKTKTKTVAEQVSWTEGLPEGGGAWGKSIRSTAEQMEFELVELEKLKAEVTEKVNGRRKILTETVKRAEKEAKLLYSNKAIDVALAKSEKAEPRPDPKADKAKAQPSA